MVRRIGPALVVVLIGLTLAPDLAGAAPSTASGSPSAAASVGSWDVNPPVGAGRTYVVVEPSGQAPRIYTQADASIGMSVAGDALHLVIDGDDDTNISMAASQGLAPGYDDDLVQWWSRSPGQPSVSQSLEGDGCSTDGGWLAIDELQTAGDAVLSATVRYEYRCELDGHLTHVKIRWVAGDMTTAPGPTAIPAGLWDVSPAVAPGQSYAYIERVGGSWREEPKYGAGTQILYTKAESGLRLNLDGARLSLDAFGDDRLSVDFLTMDSLEQVEPGYYPDVNLPLNGNPRKGRLSIDALAPCDLGSGWAAVDELVRVGDVLRAATMRFSVDCGVLTLRGKVRWNADDPTVAAPPVTPVPAGLWDERPTVSPGGSYVFIQGADPDYVSGGQDWVLPFSEAPPSVKELDGGRLYISGLRGAWVFDLEPMSSLDQLEVGFYDRTTKDTSNPARGTLRVSAGGRGCNLSRGWFAIDRIERTAGVITNLTLRFEHRCDLGAPMYGRIQIGPEPPVNPTLPIQPGPPFGSLDVAMAVPSGVQVAGWAIDPDTAEPIDVHVYVDGQGTALRADASRPDVAAAYRGYGSGHGFSATILTTPGRHQVCAYGINVGAGGNALLGCRTVTVTTGSPFGSLDVARQGPSSVVVGGWALDPDTNGSIAVHVYVDGKGTALTANGSRPDVGALFPGYGSAHGFSATIPTTPGAHQVCAYGINTGAGGNTLLGCRSVTVPSGSPIGTVDVARGGPGWVSVGGWALDADTGDPIAVHVYVDGRGTAITAGGNRPDVGAYFFGWGDAHGYATTISATPGTHEVCVYGINVGPGGNTLLGCRTVTVT